MRGGGRGAGLEGVLGGDIERRSGDSGSAHLDEGGSTELAAKGDALGGGVGGGSSVWRREGDIRGRRRGNGGSSEGLGKRGTGWSDARGEV